MSHRQQTLRAFVTVSVVAAVAASFAAANAWALSLPVWAVFVGRIAFFSRGLTTRSTFENLGCVAIKGWISHFLPPRLLKPA